MVLKSPVKISTAVLGHKEKSLSVIGFLAGRIQKLFISFSKRGKKRKTCNYCILTPRQAITSQKLSPGNQTLAWLIRLTSLTNPLLEIGCLDTGGCCWARVLPVTGDEVALHRAVLCFFTTFFYVFLEAQSLSQRQALIKKKALPNRLISFIARGGSWKNENRKESNQGCKFFPT